MNDRRPRVSVIVPTLNEADGVDDCLSRVRQALGPDAEVLVVDGGSRDNTRDVASRHARVVTSEPGRGIQLAAGGREAAGNVLIFLHADTWLEPGAAEAIEVAIAGGAAGGCFRLGFRDQRSFKYRALAAAINLRTRLFRTATGDQAIFATREAYRATGGFEPVPVFEDVRFVRALRRQGAFRAVRPRALTSARRWEREGFLRTIVLHLALRVRHQLGADPHELGIVLRREARRMESKDRPPISDP